MVVIYFELIKKLFKLIDYNFFKFIKLFLDVKIVKGILINIINNYLIYRNFIFITINKLQLNILLTIFTIFTKTISFSFD